jgi:hypothetical protein
MSARPGLWTSLGLALLLSAGLASPASAAVLATQNVNVAGPDLVLCRISNLGTGTFTVTIQLVDGVGSVIDERVRTVSPGRMEFLQFGPNPNTYTFNASCRFTGPFTKGLVRAGLDTFSVAEGRSILAVTAE